MEDTGETDEAREYKKTIERNFTTDFEKELIDKAESYYPPREDIINAISKETIEIPDTLYWYYDDFDGVRIPYCITVDAVNFYSGLITNLNKNKTANFFITAKFAYKADVSFHEIYYSPSKNSKEEEVTRERFESAYVVTLQLGWEDDCGSLCGLSIYKQRIVVFNKEGELLKVFLDGVAPLATS
jgi:hypothetical protein